MVETVLQAETHCGRGVTGAGGEALRKRASMFTENCLGQRLCVEQMVQTDAAVVGVVVSGADGRARSEQVGGLCGRWEPLVCGCVERTASSILTASHELSQLP